MNKKYIIGVVIFSLLGALYATIYELIGEHKTKVLPYKIVYYPNKPGNFPILFIRDVKYKKEYLEYVNKEMSNKKKIRINFPYQNSLKEGDTIYVRKYLGDSILVEFYSPNNHKRIWGYRTGYLHRSLIHDTLTNE